jgi:hypothetical protein
MFEQAKLQDFVDATSVHHSSVLLSVICFSYSPFSVSQFLSTRCREYQKANLR